MTQDAVTHSRNNAVWTIVGIVLTAIGVIAAIIAFIYGNSWDEEEGTEHGVIQAVVLIGAAFAVGLGVLGIIIGAAKRAGPNRR